MRISIWLAASALVALPNTSIGQIPADNLVRGDHVRYELTGPFENLPEKSEAYFLALTASDITLSGVKDLDPRRSVELPRELIDDFEVTRGTEDVRWLGAVVGGLTGLALGVTAAFEDGGSETAIILGPLVGGSLGYLVGRMISGPKWVDVSLR